MDEHIKDKVGPIVDNNLAASRERQRRMVEAMEAEGIRTVSLPKIDTLLQEKPIPIEQKQRLPGIER